jgi:mycothiol synthase
VPPTVTRPEVLDADTASAVRALVRRIAADGGGEPLSDQARTQLGSTSVEHAVALDGGAVVGYAQLDGRSLEIVARDAALDALLDAFSGRDVLIWSHGSRSPLAAALRRRGFVAQRELHQLRRRLTDDITAAPAPAAVRIAPFRVGVDEDAWLAVNAAAFAHHPEQGGWTRADLEAREAEPWFEAAGFLLAWRENELVGFHWTKVHDDGAGEVYVLATAPSAQGTGLGSVLLNQGLAHLQRRGCPEVLLYVDGDNATARRLYERDGFRPYDLDVQWAAPGQSAEGTVSNT